MAHAEACAIRAIRARAEGPGLVAPAMWADVVRSSRADTVKQAPIHVALPRLCGLTSYAAAEPIQSSKRRYSQARENLRGDVALPRRSRDARTLC